MAPTPLRPSAGSIPASFAVEAAVPPNTTYRVIIYDADQNAVNKQRVTADETIDFSVPDPPYEPGSYAIRLFADGVHQKLHPLLVRGFDVTVDALSSVTKDETIDVTVNVTRTASTESILSVDVAVVDSDDTLKRTPSKVSQGTYEASISLDSLETGSYRIYATVNGEDEAFDRQERLGISEASSLEVTEPASGGGGGGGGFAAPSTSPTPTTTSTTPTKTTTISTSTAIDPETTTTLPQSRQAGTSSEPGATGSDAETTDEMGTNVITPAPSPPPMDDRPDETSTPLPGFGLLSALAAVVIGASAALRRARVG